MASESILLNPFIVKKTESENDHACILSIIFFNISRSFELCEAYLLLTLLSQSKFVSSHMHSSTRFYGLTIRYQKI